MTAATLMMRTNEDLSTAKPRRVSKFSYIRDGDTPHHGLTWPNYKERGIKLKKWTDCVYSAVGSEPRTLRLAATLSKNFHMNHAYCARSDAELAEQSHIDVKNVPRTLARLEAEGLIIRRHVRSGRFNNRRIWARMPKGKKDVTAPEVDTETGQVSDPSRRHFGPVTRALSDPSL